MKLSYREFGDGQPLIILHGLFGQSDNWNTLAKNFAQHGFHVFTLDQRNHGLSPHSNEWNYEVMADDLNEFILEHQLKSPVLMGHSMGGKTILAFEKKYPGVADKLVIVDMAARAYPPHHAEVLKALHAVDFDKIENRKEAEEILTRYIPDFGTRQFLLKNIYWKEGEDKKMGWRFNLKTISERYDDIGLAVPFFKSPVKTLIVNGALSKYVNELDKEDFRNRFSDVKFETVAGAGHWVHAEKPGEFFETVLSFIKA